MIRVVFISFFIVGAALQAQGTDTTARPPQDSVILRAKQLTEDGRGAEGRRLIDSVLKAAPPESELYAEALYWRGALANTAADAEKDYRRLLIEAPLSARAEDALLQLAQLEQARGDRQGATDHLQRFMLSYAKSPERPRVAIWLVRLLFEQGPQQTARACEALKSGRDEIPADNAELRNQLEFYAPRCAVEAVASAPADTQPPPPQSEPARPPPRRPPPARDTVRRERPPSAPRITAGATKTVGTTKGATTRGAATKGAATKGAATKTTGTPAGTTAGATAAPFYSVQVAAYDTREQAARLARLLVSRGTDARVDGTVRPFRVRVGKYRTRSAAVKAMATLKSQGYAGFVALVTASPE